MKDKYWGWLTHEMLVRCITINETFMIVEAIASSAIEGIKRPTTEAELDSLAAHIIRLRGEKK